jgi:hypothetical protein
MSTVAVPHALDALVVWGARLEQIVTGDATGAKVIPLRA